MTRRSHTVLWIVVGAAGAGFFVMLRCLPETKGKSLEEIERELVD